MFVCSGTYIMGLCISLLQCITMRMTNINIPFFHYSLLTECFVWKKKKEKKVVFA